VQGPTALRAVRTAAHGSLALAGEALDVGAQRCCSWIASTSTGTMPS
jgi:hypothetical protein